MWSVQLKKCLLKFRSVRASSQSWLGLSPNLNRDFLWISWLIRNPLRTLSIAVLKTIENQSLNQSLSLNRRESQNLNRSQNRFAPQKILRLAPKQRRFGIRTHRHIGLAMGLIQFETPRSTANYRNCSSALALQRLLRWQRG